MALRFVPYSDDAGHFRTGWSILMGALLLGALAASVYVVATLEILKFGRLRTWQLRRADPDTSEHEIALEVRRELETGEWEAVPPRAEGPEPPPAAPDREAPGYPASRP